MSGTPVLLSCQAGFPADPKVWSGTPARLFESLGKEGGLAPVPHSSVAAGLAGRAAARCDRLLGLRYGFMQGPAQRYLSARSALHAARSNGCAGILHLGTFDVPPVSPGLQSYLYVDNSYDFWERHSSFATKLSAHQRRWFRRLERHALSRARHVFTVGEHIARSVVESFGIPAERVTAVGTGLGSIRPYHGRKDYGNGRLLIVAKVRPRDKGLFVLADAFALARKQLPHLTLTVIGGERYPELRNREGIYATGWISAEELQNLFETSALYVMPATYEPWGISYLEALACQIPVMGLNRGALPEITGSGAHGFLLEGEPGPEKLAESVVDALSDRERLARMGAEGQRYCLERYQWDKIAKRIAAGIASSMSSGAA